MKEERQRTDDTDFEILFYEGILRRSPDFVQALMALGDLYTRKGLYERGLMIDKRLSQLRPDDPLIFYNLACSYSLLKCVDEAYETIKFAIDCGYDNFRYLVQDRDLTNLLKEPRFRQYLSDLLEKEKPVLEKKNDS
jgi:tetratricopeptide (TPR) repeat protein